MRALTWNYGGGTQSTAIAWLIAEGRLPRPERIIMADTGREAAETWEYTERWVKPLLTELGLTLEIATHDLATVDLYSHKGTLLIPATTGPGGGKFSTFCSSEWKAYVVQRYLRSLGYGPKRPVLSWIGLSVTEIGRIKPSGLQWQKLHWPLAFDVPLTRADCRALVLRHGWPEPPKSSCYICPHRRNSQWVRLKTQYPADWQAAVELDEAIRAADPLHRLALHHSGLPLVDVDLSVPDVPELPLFGQIDGCDSGYCMV